MTDERRKQIENTAWIYREVPGYDTLIAQAERIRTLEAEKKKLIEALEKISKIEIDFFNDERTAKDFCVAKIASLSVGAFVALKEVTRD